MTVRCLAIVAVERWTCALAGYFAKHVLPAGAFIWQDFDLKNE